MNEKMKFPNLFKKIAKVISPRSIILLLVNILIIGFLFVGLRKLFLAPQASKTLPGSAKEASSLENGPVPGEESNKKKKPPLSLLPAVEESVPVKVYQLGFSDFTDELPTVGTVKSIPEIELKFEVSGTIRRVNVKEGDKVKKRDLLAELNSKDVVLEIQWSDAKLKAAQAEYKSMNKRLEVIKKLYQIGSIIKSRLEQAQGEVNVARAKVDVSRKELELSKHKLEKLKMVAPRAGVIARKEKDAYEFVTPNDNIFALMDPDNIFVEIGIIEKDIFKIKSGQKVKVRVDTYPTRIFFGYIETIFPQIDERTRTATVRIRVLDPGKLLKAGMFAHADIAVFSKRKALVVPSSAVSIQKGAYYASLVENDKITYQPISVAYITTDFAVVKKGLSEKDLVVIETPGMKRLAAGTGVKIIEKQEKLF